MAEDGEICLICFDGILEKPVSALGCGHVYHRSCIMSWLKQSKGECPQCKKPSVELRALEFDQTTALLSSNTEICADRQAAEEQRRRMLVELDEKGHSVLEELNSGTRRRQDAHEQAYEAKLERRELQEQETGDEATREAIQEGLDEVHKRCAMTRFHLDQSHQTQPSKLPVSAPRQDAEDGQYERRKLHQTQQAGLRASDRAKDLHQQLISAFKLAVEMLSLARKRQVAAKEAEAIVRTLRLQVEHIRKQMNEIQESLDFSSTRSDVSSVPLKTPSPGVRSLQSGSPSSPSSPAVAKVLNVLHRRPATPNSSAAGGLKQTTPEDDEEDRLLFGGPAKLQRKGSGGFGKATVKPLQRTPSTQVVTTKPKKSNLKSLFDPF